MNHEIPDPQVPVPEPRQPETPDSPALAIYEHFMGLQRLRGWLRNN